jgi:hypothetical protein
MELVPSAIDRGMALRAKQFVHSADFTAIRGGLLSPGLRPI